MEPEKINRIKVVLVEQGKTGKWLIPQYVLLYQHQCDALNSGRQPRVTGRNDGFAKAGRREQKGFIESVQGFGVWN